MAGPIFLIHWNGPEAEERARPLHDAGWDVEIESADGARAGDRIKDNPPAAVVIDLDRLPSHGRETAAYLRSVKATRGIPIVFVGGEGEALEKTRRKVPDATFTTVDRLLDTLQSIVGSGQPAEGARR